MIVPLSHVEKVGCDRVRSTLLILFFSLRILAVAIIHLDLLTSPNVNGRWHALHLDIGVLFDHEKVRSSRFLAAFTVHDLFL